MPPKQAAPSTTYGFPVVTTGKPSPYGDVRLFGWETRIPLKVEPLPDGRFRMTLDKPKD